MRDAELKNDREIERARYDMRAIEIMRNSCNIKNIASNGSSAIPLIFRDPYLDFEDKVKKHTIRSSVVLEIGSGTGAHTGNFLGRENSLVIATDISKNSLELLNKRYSTNKELCIQVADMEALPFADCTFDLVASAGSLSYGDNYIVMTEIYRVLKPGGFFICVDSLNHNPAYRLNRWVHYLRSKRTLSTIKRIPKLNTLEEYRVKFGSTNVCYFGSISWLVPLIAFFLGGVMAASISRQVDKLFRINKSAFKFVMVSRKDI